MGVSSAARDPLVVMLSELAPDPVEGVGDRFVQIAMARLRGELDMPAGDVHVGLVVVAGVRQSDLVLRRLRELLAQQIDPALALPLDRLRVRNVLEVDSPAHRSPIPAQTTIGAGPSLQRENLAGLCDRVGIQLGEGVLGNADLVRECGDTSPITALLSDRELADAAGR